MDDLFIYIILPVLAVIVVINLLFILSILGSFMKNERMRRISRTVFLTEILVLEFLLLDFNIILKIILFIVQFAIIVITVWNLSKVSNKRRIVYCCILFSMVVSVSTMDIFNKIYYIPDYVNPLIYKNYQPFSPTNVLATLDTHPNLDFDKNYPLPKLDGATAMYPFYAAAYQELYDSSLDMNIYLNCNSSEYAFDKLNEGEADIVFLAGISEEQREDYEFEFTVTPLCKDAFVFIVPIDNPVSSLTTEDLNQIYSGKSSHNWNAFGGRDMRIRVYRLIGQNMGSNVALNEFLNIQENDDIYIRIGGMGRMVYAVYRNAGGSLGYTYRYFVKDMMDNYEVKLLRINDIAPTTINIEKGSYPFIKTFVAVSREDNNNPNVKILLDWLKGPQGQELAEKTGYVPIN